MPSAETISPRQPHAALDLASRHLKAKKIEELLGLAGHSGVLNILEIGTGSGGIAHYFGTHPQLKCHVVAVDVYDNRQIHDGYEYQNVQGVILPFDEKYFDVVMSNHVIEHVGDTEAQQNHLKEIFRVLKPEGVGYIAVPNRWMLTEPHYHLRFLSWLPRSWRSPYLHFRGRGDFYDCEPLQAGELERMLVVAGLTYRNICVEALKKTFAIEHAASLTTRLLKKMPDVLLAPFNQIIPTLVYRVQREAIPGLARR